ncbi:MAG: hypothetical protein GYA86_05105 [Firmicutes bacterium]|nr:hypothetical protein [Bacillota bacterium]
MGRADRPKGLLKTGDPSKKIIPLTQDLNYYFQKGNYYHRKNKLSKALLFLNRAIEIEPLNAKSHYHLACLLSQSSRLREANRVFKHLVNNLDPELTECYYLMAINYGLMDNMDKARHYLQKYLRLSPEGAMAEEARDLLLVMEESDEEDYIAVFTSQDNEALEKWLSSMERESLSDNFMDETFNSLLQRALYQGNDRLKEKIIHLCGRSKSGAGAALLKDFVANPWIRERLRQLALLELKNNFPEVRVQLFSGGRLVEKDLVAYEPGAPVWQREWQEVLDCVYSTMCRSSYYREKYYEDARAIWFDFINEIYPKMPRIVKPETWAAGLEYCLARFHLLSVTQEQLANAYGVSTSSVGRRYKQIDNLLKIEQKAFRKMLALLAHHELDE